MPDITNNIANYPASGDYTTNQSLVDQARGQAAQFIGQPFNIYRVTEASNGDVIQESNLVFANYPVRKLKAHGTEGPRVETDVNPSLIAYSLFTDMSLLLTGDVGVLDDPVYGKGHTGVNFDTTQFNGFGIGMTYTQLGQGLGGRLDRNVTVFRPAQSPNEDGYLDTTLTGALPLQCVSGAFVLGENGQAASKIPSGFLPAPRRFRGPAVSNMPDMAPRVHWSVYVIPLNGFHFRRGDILQVDTTTDVYRVMAAFWQDEGFVGWFLTVEQEISPL